MRDLDQALQLILRVCPPDAAARHHGGTLRFADEPGRLLDGIGIGQRSVVRREVLGRLGYVVRAEEHIEWDVHEHGTGAAAQRRPNAVGRERVGLLRRPQRHRLFGQALNDRDVVHLLQGAHAPSRLGCAAANQEHRTVARLRLRQRGDRVGDARAGRDRGDSTFARDFGPPFGGKRRRLLVAHVDDANAVLGGPGEDRPDVASVEREQMADP